MCKSTFSAPISHHQTVLNNNIYATRVPNSGHSGVSRPVFALVDKRYAQDADDRIEARLGCEQKKLLWVGALERQLVYLQLGPAGFGFAWCFCYSSCLQGKAI